MLGNVPRGSPHFYWATLYSADFQFFTQWMKTAGDALGPVRLSVHVILSEKQKKFKDFAWPTEVLT
jgi:hypothetical protein